MTPAIVVGCSLVIALLLILHAALQAGDRVVYSKYAGTEVALGDQEHVLLKVSSYG